MPQTLNTNWKMELGDDFEEIHQDYVNNIGNLTLIRHNQELGNKSFPDKKGVYEHNAGLQLAKTKIIDQDKWNKESILKRNAWITQFIIEKVLPIPVEMKHKNNFISKRR